MNTNVVLGIVLIAIVIAITQILQSLYYRRVISLLRQENKTAVTEAFGKGWDACVDVTRRKMPETKMTRVNRNLTRPS